ncbi:MULTISPECIES: Na+/H+ antiporter [Chryseobacterium]|uniref:Na+/H+ antiporter n=1 Tax=Chryseobacterium TaxID=59732 RepID=UPI0012956140|nr:MULTISPECIES: Na+/H+ antiporter [Chryseobacterium]MDR6919842.1 CPA1 family monovalent cation:H+ antiporter [Chryseobacterium sp. 2987]
MHNNLLIILGLLFVVMLLVLLANKVKIAYPIFLVVAGLGISFIPGVPLLHLDPDLIFLIFLPPLLYEAAWYTSWNDFWKWKYPIALLAFGLVFFTSSIIAFSSYALIPGFTVALGFLIGGIVSPPDAVAAATVLKGMNVPKRLMTILEGESLINDASSLIVFKFALIAVLSGTFSMEEATGDFFLVAGMGIVIGLIGANMMYVIHRFLPTTPAIDGVLTVMTPYILFLIAEQFHYSGVMAVVTGGLFMSYRSHEVFQTGSTRLNMLGVWTTMIFVMNALVFILIGLELPEIVSGLEGYSIMDAVKYGVAISVITIGVRFLWVFSSTYLLRLMSAKARMNPSGGWKGSMVLSWSGMRGVVSLATALSIPIMINDDVRFPHRNLIIFITFIVIFVTLVFQGLSLPFLIRLIKVREIDEIVPEDKQRVGIQFRLNTVALNYVNNKRTDNVQEIEVLQYYKAELESENDSLNKNTLSLENKKKEIYDSNLLLIYALQRKELFKLRKEKFFSDDEIRNAELQLDLKELKITGMG